MFRVSKQMEISASHKLDLPYESPCCNLHGHNYYVTVYVRAERLNKAGMVIDFMTLKRLIHDKMDHKHLNDLFGANPTGEFMAGYIAGIIDADRTIDDIERKVCCYRVDVEETRNNIATWEKDDEN